jgi:hypothetical protein
MGMLREFFGRLVCENDPFKLDLLVSVLSQRVMKAKKNSS